MMNEDIKWYQKSWGIWLLIFLFFPVGLYMLWKYGNFSKRTKGIITITFLLIGIIGNINSPQKQVPTYLTTHQEEKSNLSEEVKQELKDKAAGIKPQSEPQPEESAQLKKIIQVNEVLLMEGHPRLNDNVETLTNFYKDLAISGSSSVISITATDQINVNNEVLIFKYDPNQEIDEIVAYPQKAGLNLNLEESKALIKNYIPVDRTDCEFSYEDSAIFIGDGKPSLYVWKYGYDSDAISTVIEETNGYVTSFATFCKGSHKVPFLNSMQGYEVAKSAPNTQENNSSSNLQKYDNEKRVSTSYVGNLSTGKFHKSSCDSVRKMNPANVVELSSRDEAINAGYVPCKRCNP